MNFNVYEEGKTSMSLPKDIHFFCPIDRPDLSLRCMAIIRRLTRNLSMYPLYGGSKRQLISYRRRPIFYPCIWQPWMRLNCGELVMMFYGRVTSICVALGSLLFVDH